MPASITTTPPNPDVDLYCPGCSYDLRALTSDTCPECGHAVDVVELRRPTIAWARTSGFCLAKAWAFVRTTWVITWRPSRFCREVAKPVSLSEARWYRRIVILLIWLSAIGTIIADAWSFSLFKGNRDFIQFIEEQLRLPIPIAAAGLALLLALLFIGGTGLHLYWFHAKSQPTEIQNRAVALGHYACAPLAWLPLFAVLNAIGDIVETLGSNAHNTGMRDLGQGLWITATMLSLIVVFLFWRNTWVFAGKAAKRSGFGQITLAIALPLLWIAWLLLVMVAIPAAFGFVAVVIYTW